VADKTASGKLRWIVCAGIWTFVYGLSAIGPVFLQNLHPENGPFCIIRVCISSLMKMTNSVRDGVGFPLDTPWKEFTFITV